MTRIPLRLVPSPDSKGESLSVEPSDRDLLERVAGGDIGALGALYDRHARVLLRFATRAGGSADAEDAVQTTFERAALSAGAFDGRAPSARSWLFGIAVRVVQERRRSIVRFARALLRLDGSATHLPEGEARRDLQKGLVRLGETKRVVLLLAEVEGFTCQEIADMLGVPVGTVWTRLHHARREMRAYFEESER